MFRHTVTFVLIFLVVNHDFAAARSAAFVPQTPLKTVQKRWIKVDENTEATEGTGSLKETGVVEGHSRVKRGRIGSAIKAGLSLGAGGSFLFSTVSTVYHAIRKCKDYQPRKCVTATCRYLTDCPTSCHGPETNRLYVKYEKEEVKRKLDKMDAIQRDAFNLATQAISAGLNNQRIFAEVDRINQKVDELIFSIARMDVRLASKFRNSSVAISGLIRNQRLSLDEIVSSTEVAGIFDKWTWDGTGVFVLSAALPLGLHAFTYFKERHAINQIAKNLKSDFEARFVNQRTSRLNPNAKLHNKFANVQGYTTKDINRQLKQTAKAIHLSDKANRRVSKVEKITNNVITPLVNAIVIALSVWSAYTQINNCYAIADDMQDTAKKMAEKADEIEGLKQTQVDPLLKNVTTQAWPKVRAMMKSKQSTQWFEEIRNLTINANTKNATVAAVIVDFINRVPTAGYNLLLNLQRELIIALKSIDYEYSCLADKQHAISTVLTDCRIGRRPFPALYQYATGKHKLNRDGCIARGIFPYTSQDQFFTILNATATHQGWYSNCLLNSEDLLYRVCAEKIKGYTTPKEIVKQANKTGLTEDMVPHFLGRCPPPRITPKSIKDTCTLYCAYQPVASIAKTAVLLESQVLEIMKTCPLCEVSGRDLKKICTLFKCTGENATTIEKDVEMPLPTVKFVMANNCTKCNLDDPITQKRICVNYKCRGYSSAANAKDVGLIESAVNDILPKCDSVVPDCINEVSEKDKGNMQFLHCSYGISAARLVGFFNYKEELIARILALKPCPTSNGFGGFNFGR
ncbi:uncharacterized protein LOC114517259 [Dendronephthya gigantea]|uniref:uncharacterized protein LOC114517259 n=1 Tax=Dendronephthya gigantea TaxID=151771 RepID=UPI00106D319A|nr:uncharacterized protein LOC114517259 [Dendronephthya gigantea]XP_028392728.1 uncharacterized protein LOC114517259 [Dendronephthya gigantea]